MLRKLSLLGLSAAAVLNVQAIDFIATNSFTTAADEQIPHEQWAVAETNMVLNGTHANDLFLMSGGLIELNGQFEGNIWAAGGFTVQLNGNCERNLRAAGKALTVQNGVGGNCMLAGESIALGTNAVVQGSAMLFGTSVSHEGRIKGDADILAGKLVTIEGVVEGDVKVTAPEIFIAKSARIMGDLNYTSNKELFLDDGIVEGSLNRVKPEPQPIFSTQRLTGKFFWFLSAFLAGMPFIALFPMTTAMATELIKRKPFQCLGIGVLATITMPLIGFICISSFIGLPLGALILGSWGAMAYLSRIIMAMVLGAFLIRNSNSSFGKVILSMTSGLALIYLSTIVPSLIGLAVQAAVICMGTGAFILSLLEKRRLIIQVPRNLQKLEKLRDEKFNPEEEER